MMVNVRWSELVPVVNHLWQSTLVVGVAWILCHMLLARNHPRVRFAVWSVASAKFLVPFSLLVGAGRWLRPFVFVTTAQSRRVSAFVSTEAVPLAAPFRIAHASAAHGAWGSTMLPSVVLFVWAAGTALVLLSWLRGWTRIRRALRDAVPTGQFGGVPVLQSSWMREARMEPGVVGVWTPLILLPSGIEESLSDLQLRAVLLHEWNHARRGDNLAAAPQMLVEAAFWFYPITWWVGRRLMDERERACDRDVLDVVAPDDYAHGILNICKWYFGWPSPYVAGITGAGLRSRIEAVLRNERPVPVSAWTRGALAATLIAVVLTPVAVGRLVESTVFAQAQAGNSFLGIATTTAKSFDVATVKPSANAEDGHDVSGRQAVARFRS